MAGNNNKAENCLPEVLGRAKRRTASPIQANFSCRFLADNIMTIGARRTLAQNSKSLDFTAVLRSNRLSK